ncbi:MAG: hypothetical protein H6744_09965 [Deltaproteobacteria bacterium]|nr:hypothetical protein [Deltaproteobacteria bacterium]MCB9787003.1 hypothetical protein [Deltaproteobacteria bacterium]
MNTTEGAWWTQRWVDPLEEARDLRQKLRKGRVLTRRGRVTEMDVRPGLVTAMVAEDTGVPSSVRLRQPVIQEAVWSRVVERIARSAGQASQLLQGRITEQMVQYFEEEGAELFPFDQHDLTYFCTCRDDAAVCVHAVAVHYALADVINGDPLVIFEFRGRSRAELMEALRGARTTVIDDSAGGEEEAVDTEVADSLLDTYWKAGIIPHLAFRLSAGDLEEGAALPVIRALGPGPGETSPDEIADVLAPIVRMGRRRVEELVEQVTEEDVPDAPNPTSAESLDDVLVAAAYQHGSLTSSFVADALGVSVLEARRYLQWLVDEGRLAQVGRARGTRYVPLEASE